MTRREFPAKIKAEAFRLAGGRCEGCGARLGPGNVHYDHRIPDALGGEPTQANCQALCTNCHGAKTAKADVPRIAKAKRVERSHIGAKSASRSPLPGGRASKWKRKLDGTVERRE